MALATVFTPVDVTAFHRDLLPERAAGPRGAEAARSVGSGRALSIRLSDQRCWTYTAHDDHITVSPDEASAPVVVVGDEAAFSDMMSESWSMMGLVFQGRISIERGEFGHLAAWEAALQALYNDRPIWQGEGTPALAGLDLTRRFRLDDDRSEMAHQLATAGFVVVSSVFDENEVAAMRADVESQRSGATPDDKRSWWATAADGTEHCCRVTYLNQRSTRFANLALDARLATLAALAPTELLPTPDHGDGVSVVVKCPEIVEGLSDLPWHRDCGMGGHPVLCPGLNVGVQLDQANAGSGQLKFLAGTNGYAGGQDTVDLPDAPVVAVDAEPGDVTVHYGHTLHVAPPPTGAATYRRTVYVSFHVPEYLAAIPAGQGYNDVLFGHGDGRVRAPGEA